MKCSVGLMRQPGIFLLICVQNSWQLPAICSQVAATLAAKKMSGTPDLAFRFKGGMEIHLFRLILHLE